jgi:hypothetical protein
VGAQAMTSAAVMGALVVHFAVPLAFVAQERKR